MKSVVKDTQEYQDVVNDYYKIYLKEDGSVDQDKIIKEAIGKVLANYLIKEFFVTMTDEKLNRLIHSASAIALKDFSVISLIKELIIRNPDLLKDLKNFGISI